MNKSITKLINNSIKKLKAHKVKIKKISFSTYQEDFVITEQEEREGGFFGNSNFKIATSLK